MAESVIVETSFESSIRSAFPSYNTIPINRIRLSLSVRGASKMNRNALMFRALQKWMTMDENVKKEEKKGKGQEKDEENEKDKNKE